VGVKERALIRAVVAYFFEDGTDGTGDRGAGVGGGGKLGDAHGARCTRDGWRCKVGGAHDRAQMAAHVRYLAAMEAAAGAYTRPLFSST